MLPEGCDISGKWQYREDEITAFRPSEEVLLTTNIKRRNTFLQQATTHAFPLQSALALGIATPQQQEMLMLLQHYGQHLMEMDLTQENPDWPLWPQETA
ncbi:tail fiber assembly protein [Edaphovirga cremea]|uniref:tail fiber assembly protein n=1 Tax=Edaphovirga cremea TaxID=2267246 RepID=UPI000DEEC7D0